MRLFRVLSEFPIFSKTQSLLKEKQLDQISLYLTRNSALNSSVVIRRIFCFSLVLAIVAITGFSTYNFNINS